ncbi:MAG: GbsR/MarR family transcriptional regulator [Salibacteraceae bacterium]
MEFEEGREKFIQAWGTLGSSWGINRTMAQIQALLLISPESMTTESIMEELNISRGNANMSLRALMDWGVVFKENRPGERKDYFYAEKDIWKVAVQVTRERRRRELEPLIRVLGQVESVPQEDGEEYQEFKKVTEDISKFADKVDGLFDKLAKADEHWFVGNFLKLLR